MEQSLKKSGRKIIKKWSKLSHQASEDSKEHLQENFVNRISHVRNVRLLILEWGLLVAAILFLAITQDFWYHGSYTTSTYEDGGTYSEATLGKVNSLNPLFATTNSEKALSKLMFATLSAPDYSGHTGLDLAASIKADDTGKIWTIKLRDNLKWSDGQPISNADVLYTVKTLQDSTIRSPYSSNLTGVKVTEESGNLIFTLSSAFVNFPSSLDIPILPSHILSDTNPSTLIEHSFSTKPITSGPFTFNATQSLGNDGEKIIYLSRNEHYFMRTPLLSNFTIHAYPSIDNIKNAVKTGTVTATAELPPDDTELTTTNVINERQTTINSGIFAFFNLSSPLLGSRDLRRALQRGINVPALRDLIHNGQPLDYPILSNQMILENYPALPDYSPDAAKTDIFSLGLPEETALTIATVTTGKLPEIANELASQLKTLGLNATVQSYEPNQDFLVGILRPRAYDILIYDVELGPDPDLFAYYHSSQATESGLNLSNYKNYLVDDLILGARSTMDLKLRTSKYETFLKHWVDDVPAIGIAQSNLSYYVNKNVRTFSEDNRLVEPTDRFTDVSYWGVEKATKNRTP